MPATAFVTCAPQQHSTEHVFPQHVKGIFRFQPIRTFLQKLGVVLLRDLDNHCLVRPLHTQPQPLREVHACGAFVDALEVNPREGARCFVAEEVSRVPVT